MTDSKQKETRLILGEFNRRIDQRFRFSIPGELLEAIGHDPKEMVLAKERPGCISLWDPATWESKLEARMDLIEKKIQLGDFDRQIPHLQMLGRLLSTRDRTVQLTGRGRVVIPEGFREFLDVKPGEEIMIVGAAVCIEIWNPKHWIRYIESRMPKFRRVFDKLSS